MLSDEIGKKLETIIDRVPGGINVRPLIESSIQIALAAALEAYCGDIPAIRATTAVQIGGFAR